MHAMVPCINTSLAAVRSLYDAHRYDLSKVVLFSPLYDTSYLLSGSSNRLPDIVYSRLVDDVVEFCLHELLAEL